MRARATSRALAEIVTGLDAIATLENTSGIEAVLMDVMMPEMDGLDTTRAIRQNPRFREIPIIAVTAKAMKGDRERCIEAGAWDYLAKPVDPDELLAMLRVAPRLPSPTLRAVAAQMPGRDGKAGSLIELES